jgi:hypothetical protein
MTYKKVIWKKRNNRDFLGTFIVLYVSRSPIVWIKPACRRVAKKLVTAWMKKL